MQLKEMQSSKLGMLKGYHFSIEGVLKEYLFCQIWFIKRYGVGPQGRASPCKTLLSYP